MSRDLEEEGVYFSQGGIMPLKWTAPEVSLCHRNFRLAGTNSFHPF